MPSLPASYPPLQGYKPGWRTLTSTYGLRAWWVAHLAALVHREHATLSRWRDEIDTRMWRLWYNASTCLYSSADQSV